MRGIDPLIETTWRSLDEILKLHQLTEHDFEDKIVVDLGCGKSPIVQELEDRGINTNVISVDGRSSTLSVLASSGLASTLVQARLDALPFADGSVDMVLASYSLPMWGQSAEEIRTFYKECQRITRVGGLLSIYPIAIHEDLGDLGSRHVSTQIGALKIRRSENWETLKEEAQILPDLLSVRKIV